MPISFLVFYKLLKMRHDRQFNRVCVIILWYINLFQFSSRCNNCVVWRNMANTEVNKVVICTWGKKTYRKIFELLFLAVVLRILIGFTSKWLICHPLFVGYLNTGSEWFYSCGTQKCSHTRNMSLEYAKVIEFQLLENWRDPMLCVC